MAVGGKHVDWRVIPAFPDYEINPIGEVRTIATKESVPQFKHYGVWAYTLTRHTDTGEENWCVTKLGLIDSVFNTVEGEP
jgi:hypothetical protein